MRRLAHRRIGFTLVELLVVVAIIALLLGLLLPGLRVARRTARNAKCLSNLHQVSLACLSYETEHARLPAHVNELQADVNAADNGTYPNTIRYKTADVRPLYEPYMNLDHFNCPFIPKWSPSEATEEIVNVEYYVLGGYVGDGDPNGWTGRWVSTIRDWYYDGDHYRVLAGDRLYLDRSRDPHWTFVNHASFAGDFSLKSSQHPRPRGYGWFQETPSGQDVRERFDGNYAFTDGSAGNCLGTDPTLAEIPDRHTTNRMRSNFLMPSR